MRNEFIKELIKIADKDKRVVLLTADLGFSVLEEFSRRFPDRFYNVGVSEQNMIGMATGLAEAGLIPFVYSIGPFSLLRPYEFIKNGPILHNLPVRIVSIGPGFEYGELGSTHHLIEDIAVTRLFPNLITYSPINSENAKSILSDSYSLNNPIYYRIGKNRDSLSDGQLYDETDYFIKLADGDSHICVFTIGSVLEELIESNEELKKNKINITSYAIKRIDNLIYQELLSLIKMYKNIITIEAHYINGGIGSMIAEIIAENCLRVRLHRLGVRSLSDGIFGNIQFMHKKHGLCRDQIVSLIERIL